MKITQFLFFPILFDTYHIFNCVVEAVAGPLMKSDKDQYYFYFTSRLILFVSESRECAFYPYTHFCHFRGDNIVKIIVR